MRNREYVRRCIEVAKSEAARGHRAGTRRIALLAIYGGAPSFYISYCQAYKIVKKYRNLAADERRPKPDDKPAVLRAKHLTERVLSTMQKKQLGFEAALSAVLVGGAVAPQFYFSVDYGMRLLNRYTKQVYNYQPVKDAV